MGAALILAVAIADVPPGAALAGAGAGALVAWVVLRRLVPGRRGPRLPPRG